MYFQTVQGTARYDKKLQKNHHKKVPSKPINKTLKMILNSQEKRVQNLRKPLKMIGKLPNKPKI